LSCDSRGPTYAVQGKLVLGSQADDEYALGWYCAPWIENPPLASLALKVSIAYGVTDDTAHSLVDGPGSATGLDSLEQVYDNQFILTSLNAA
jgi:hypothetical protein